MRKLVPILALGALSACSPAQEAAWMRWWHREPDEAAKWAVEECGALCTDDWDGDGVVEPEPTVEEPAEASAADSPQPENVDDEGDGDVIDDQYPTLGGSCSEWSDDALAVGWSVDQWDTLSYIMQRESNCSPSAYNPSGASGLLQIMPMWADDCGGGDLFDPWFNLSCGLHVYHVQGWSAWSTY